MSVTLQYNCDAQRWPTDLTCSGMYVTHSIKCHYIYFSKPDWPHKDYICCYIFWSPTMSCCVAMQAKGTEAVMHGT